MLRALIAASAALLVLSQVNAADSGRSSIRSQSDVEQASMVAPAAGAGCASGNCDTHPGHPCHCGLHDGRTGLHPTLAKLFWWKKSCGMCSKCGGLFGPRLGGSSGLGGSGFGKGDGFNPYPEGVPGTLVFPQHPFVRSPRDFWMWEAK